MALLKEINIFLQEYLTMLNRSEGTIKGYKSDLEIFNDWLADNYNVVPEIELIDRENIEKYLYFLKKERNYADTSRKRHFNSIKSFLNFAVRENKIDYNPALEVAKFKVAKKEREFLSEEEVMAMIEKADNRLIAVIVSTLYYTGIRISELCNLKVQDVDFTANRIYIKQGKGRKDRTIPLNNKLREKLVIYRENNLMLSSPDDNFFATAYSGKISISHARKLLDDVVKDLGWNKKVSCHTLRHSFATNLLRKGVNLYEISKLLGHSSLQTTEVYLHLVDSELESAVDKL